MSDKRPISEVLIDVCSSDPKAREAAGREVCDRSRELLAIVEEAKDHDHVGPNAKCHLCKALTAAAEEPKEGR